LFLVNQFPAEHSLCEEGTVLPRQVTEGTAVKKWQKRKNTAADYFGFDFVGFLLILQAGMFWLL
jgi:hypothetical protein